MHDPPCAGVGPERRTAVHRVGAGHPAGGEGAAALDDGRPVAAGDDAEDDADAASLDERREATRRLKIDIALARSAELTALEARLYKHVVDCIDFDALFGLEQVLWFAVDRLGHGALDNETALSHRLIERALVRAAHDPHNTFSEVPPGITAAERRAARYDAECPFCEVEDEADDLDDEVAGHASVDRLEHERGCESCPLCDDTAREWRAQHADELRAAEARRAARARTRAKHERATVRHRRKV